MPNAENKNTPPKGEEGGLTSNRSATPLSPVVEKKLLATDAAILGALSDGIVALFVVGSVTRESTPSSDLDVVIVLRDRVFTQSIDRLKPLLRELSARINVQHPEHELVLWASKLDHYGTWLPDVSYIRANLSASAGRLDAWCGLAKHALLHYEAASHVCIHGDCRFLDREAFPKIPSWEAREVFLLSTRTLAQGIAELYSTTPSRRTGANHVAKAGLRAAYAVSIYRHGKALNSYAQIHEDALQNLPTSFHAIVNDLYDTKTSDSTETPSLTECLAVMHYCETQVATAPRLTFDGVAAGMRGESLAFSPEALLSKDSPVELYSRFAGAQANYAHLLYFLTTSKQIVHGLSALDWSQTQPLLLDFFFEELSVLAVFALNSPGRLRIVVGRAEREEFDLFFDRSTIEQVAGLVEKSLWLYVDALNEGSCSTPWLSTRQKLARLKIISDRLQMIPGCTGDSAVLETVTEALAWYSRILSLESGDERVHYNIGILYEEMGRTQEAVDMYRKSIDLQPDYLNPYLRLGMLLEDIDLEAAIDLLSDAEKRGIANELSLANLGNCHWKRGDLARAEQYYLAALAKNDKHADALNGMGGVLLSRYKECADASLLERSIGFFQKAVDQDPSFYGARVNLQRALELMEEAKKEEPALLSKENQSPRSGVSAPRELSMIDHVVYRLDEIRSRTGSFICRGEDDRFLSRLSELILSTPIGVQMRGFVRQMDSGPADDLIFRSNLVGVREEPRPMASVFVPRDTKRSEVYLPYFIYALGKLEQNFRAEDVQRELIQSGHDPANVHLSPMIQKVGGHRDATGALGKELTVSFSATIDLDQHECRCNVVFGLPLLATRPKWNGSLQAAVFLCRPFASANSYPANANWDMQFEWEAADRTPLQKHDSLRRRFRQTHKAVLIPEKGIVYEELDFRTVDVLYEIEALPRGSEVHFPLPPTSCRELLTLFGKVLQALPIEDTEVRGHRLDGILVRQSDGSWDSPTLVGLSPIWRR